MGLKLHRENDTILHYSFRTFPDATRVWPPLLYNYHCAIRRNLVEVRMRQDDWPEFVLELFQHGIVIQDLQVNHGPALPNGKPLKEKKVPLLARPIGGLLVMLMLGIVWAWWLRRSPDPYRGEYASMFLLLVQLWLMAWGTFFFVLNRKLCNKFIYPIWDWWPLVLPIWMTTAAALCVDWARPTVNQVWLIAIWYASLGAWGCYWYILLGRLLSLGRP